MEARQFHRLTAAHCRAKESMVRAVEAGIDLIEHVEFLDPDHEMRFDPKVAGMLAESGIWLSPTLQAWTNYPEMVRLRQQRDEGKFGAGEEAALAPPRAAGGEAPRPDAEDARLLSEGTGRAGHGLRGWGISSSATSTTTCSCWSNAASPRPRPWSRRPGSPRRRPASPARSGPSRSERKRTWPPSEGDPTADIAAFSDVRAVFQAGVRVR